MEEHTQRLIEIMQKIAFKVPWQTIKLEEDELRVLDKATGEQMVEIAYKNRIPFSRFIHQADELIDEFNENKFRQYIRDVKELKNALEAPFKCKETQEIQIGPIETNHLARERELMEAAVQEVLEGRFTDDIAARESEDNEDLRHLGSFIGKFFNTKIQDQGNDGEEKHTFVNAISAQSELGTSISLQRHASHIVEPTLFDRTRENPLNMNFGEEFVEPSLEELAELGILDGDTGRKIFNNIVSREQQDEIRRTDEMPLETSGRIPDITLPPIVPDIENMPPQIDIEFPSSFDPANVDKTPIELNTLPNIEEPQPVLEPQVEQEPNQQQSDQSVFNITKRIARIEGAPSVQDDEPTTKPSVKAPKRKPRVLRMKKDISNQEFVPFIKPLVIKPPKKVFKIRKHPNRVVINAHNFDLDIFGHFDNLPEYDIPAEEQVVVEEVIVILPDLSANKVQEPHIPMDISPQKQPQEESLVNKRAIPSPELENVSKRARVAMAQEPEILYDIQQEQHVPQQEQLFPQQEQLFPQQEQSIPPLEDFMPPLIIDSVLPENLIQESDQVSVQPQRDFSAVRDSSQPTPTIAINIGPNNVTVNPSVSSASDSLFKTPLPKKQATAASLLKFCNNLNLRNVDQSRMVSSNEAILGHLRNASRETSALNQPSPIPPMPDFSVAPELPPTTTETLECAAAPEGYREFKKKGVNMLQFLIKPGKIGLYEEYNVENMMLYLQVRKYMKMKKTEKLNVPKLLSDNVLKLRHPCSTHVMMIRLWRLCDRGLLVGKWSDDDTKLLEIELPVKKTLSDGGDKENVP